MAKFRVHTENGPVEIEARYFSVTPTDNLEFTLVERGQDIDGKTYVSHTTVAMFNKYNWYYVEKVND